jgi:hypothetical protein
MTLSPFSARVPALVLGLAVAGVAAAAGGLPASDSGSAQVIPASADPVRCEIVLDERRGMTTIEGRVSAGRAVAGSYRLAIRSASSAGSAAISQSGDFEARPGAPAILGQTTLSGPRASFRAELELNVGGQRLTCSEASGPREI